MKKWLIVFCLCVFFPATHAHFMPMAEAQNQDLETPFTRFSKKIEFTVKGIITPKVVKYQTKEYLGDDTVLVNEKGEVMSHKWISKYEKMEKQTVTVTEATPKFNDISPNNPSALVDGDQRTFFTFHPEESQTKKVVLSFAEMTEVSGIYVHVDSGIIPPEKVSIRGQFENQFVNIIDRVKFRPRLPFPTVKVKALEITYETPHYLSIAEIEILGQEESRESEELIFFAEEGQIYTLYTNPQFGHKRYSPKTPQPLKTDAQTPVFSLPESESNPDFNADFDGDGLDDAIDLCPKIKNPNNEDIDQNGRGDACEDPDLDNIYSNDDNCPFKYNPGQADADQDGQGDVCDDAETRFAESSEFFLWAIFGVVALILVTLMIRSMKKG